MKKEQDIRKPINKWINKSKQNRYGITCLKLNLASQQNGWRLNKKMIGSIDAKRAKKKKKKKKKERKKESANKWINK